jgi:polyisoprenyl-phosphate glycosyltransferase
MTTDEQRVPTLSVVVPCYNEENGIDELVRRLVPACEAVCPASFEIVLVNDGSSDRTWAKICEHSSLRAEVVGIDLSRNYGHQLALTAGLEHCRGDFVFVIDADLQDPPELLAPMMARIADGADVVYGQRIKRKGETVFKRATANVFYRTLSALVDVHIPRDTGDFRLMTRQVVDELIAMPERYRFVRGMVGSLGFRQVAFPYERDARFADETHYPLRKMIAFAIDAITGFSTVPLRFASWLGLAFGLIGLAALAWVGFSYFFGGTVRGWASLAALVLIMGSVQMLMLGVFGEYMGRMYMEAKRRPLYVVRSIEGRGIRAENPVHSAERALRRAFG